MYLSVVIPAYNEEKRLPKTLFEINKYLKQQSYEYEIIVVSDGSKDNTPKIVQDLQGQIANLKLIDNKENHGKGYVTRQGLLEAKGDFRLFMDADNSTTVDQVQNLLPFFSQGYDIVIGSRDINGANIAKEQPLYRRFLGESFGFLTSLLVGIWGISDTQCGFKMLSAKASQNILPKCLIDRFAFDPEILKIGKKLGYKIKEVPVIWINDEASTVNFKSIIKMGIDLLKIRWNLITRKYN